jgi:hypothetical protein
MRKIALQESAGRSWSLVRERAARQSMCSEHAASEAQRYRQDGNESFHRNQADNQVMHKLVYPSGRSRTVE